jgi:hypothetical protein
MAKWKKTSANSQQRAVHKVLWSSISGLIAPKKAPLPTYPGTPFQFQPELREIADIVGGIPSNILTALMAGYH